MPHRPLETPHARSPRAVRAKGRVGGVALTLVALCGLVAAGPAPAQFKPWSGASIVDDPEWQKSFLGSYGFLSGAEPDVRPSELELLKEVIDLMKVNPKAAALALAQRKPADSSAAIDFVLANLQFQNGENAAAAETYEAAISKFPDFRRAHKNLGLLRVQTNDFAGGIEHLSKAIELGERDGRAFGLLGYCYVNVENYVAAEAAYRNAILQQPDVRDWQLGLARSLVAMEKNEEAIALFSAMLEKDPTDATSWMLQANAYLGLDQPMAAAVNLEAVRMLGKAEASTLTLLGDIYMNEGVFDMAKDAYLAVVERDREGKQFQAARRAADLLTRAQAYAQAADLLGSIERRYGKSLSRDEGLDLKTLQAKVARAQGRDKEAARLLEQVVDLDGTRGDALLELARFHRDVGNDEKAMLMLERARNLDAFEYPALVELAQAKVAARDYAAAASLLREALELKNEPRVERFLAQVEEAARR
ncbi:MAG: tetratricopeptide repeat protein [Spirochaetaceae bacterium]|nr:tetratricopeptide repeat protein [Myxococcales bacterium]MCB9725969.1 tetratricopeptide repeat protein [Spirochaetaceae bacterium]